MLFKKIYLIFKVFLLVFSISLMVSCSSRNEKSSINNLLSIPLNGFQSISLERLNERLRQITQSLDTQENLYAIVSKLFSEPYSRNSAISINMIEGEVLDVYAATLIFDSIPDDDSISGYRYDITIKKNIHGSLQIIEAKESWRCWQDRGHRDFSAEPCL